MTDAPDEPVSCSPGGWLSTIARQAREIKELEDLVDMQAADLDRYISLAEVLSKSAFARAIIALAAALALAVTVGGWLGWLLALAVVAAVGVDNTIALRRLRAITRGDA